MVSVAPSEKTGTPKFKIGLWKYLKFKLARSQEDTYSHITTTILLGLAIYFGVLITLILLDYPQLLVPSPSEAWISAFAYTILIIMLVEIGVYQVRGSMDYCFYLSYHLYFEKTIISRREPGPFRLEEPIWYLRHHLNSIKRRVNWKTGYHFQDLMDLRVREKDDIKEKSPVEETDQNHDEIDFATMASAIELNLVDQTTTLSEEDCWSPFASYSRAFLEEFTGRDPTSEELINHVRMVYLAVPPEIKRQCSTVTRQKKEREVSKRERIFQIELILLGAIVTWIVGNIVFN